MKRVSLVLVLLLAWAPLTLHGDDSSQQDSEATGSKVSVTMTFKVLAKPDAKLVVLDVLLPRSIPGRQRILDVRYSSKPAQVFEKEGNTYAQFVLEKIPKDFEIAIDVEAEIYRYDLTTAIRNKEKRRFDQKENLKQWLIDETYLEKDAVSIQEAAKKLPGKDQEETIRKCFDFVVKTMKEGPYDAKDHGAAWALQKKKGDCTEFADLFVALCRAKGVPARWCEGYLLEPVADTPKHDWGEVYFEKYGWVPFDAYFAFLGRDTTFSEMRPVYLHLEHQRRDGVLNNYHYWTYRWEGGAVEIRDEFKVNSRKDLKAERK